MDELGLYNRTPLHWACAKNHMDVALALLENLGEPILSCTALIDDEDVPPTEGSELMERLGNRLDLVLDAGHCGTQPCTVIDLSGSAPQITRVGKGDVSGLGIPLP